MFDIICIGSSIVDYIGFVTEEWLAKTGAEKGGVLSITLSEWDQLLLGLRPYIQRPGGSAGTVVKGLGQLGCQSAFFSRSGNDEQAYFIRSVLRANHIENLGTMLPGYTARVICAITPDAERTFFFCGAGPNNTPDVTDLTNTIFQNTKWIHIEGYTIRNRLFLETVLNLAKKYNIQTSMDLGAFVLVRENKEFLLEFILNKIDLLFGNSLEMQALFGSEQEVESNLRALASMSVALQGELGCTIYWKGEAFHFPTNKIDPIDTLGAGDLFISGFLYGITQKWPLEKCAELANLIGGRIVSFIGAELPSQEWKEIKQRISSFAENRVMFEL